MEQNKVTVSAIRVFNQKEVVDVQLTFTTPIKGYKVVNGQRTEADVDSISLSRAQLTRELCAANDLIDMYRSCRTTAFEQKHFVLMLRGAELELGREFKAAGEPILDRDGQPVIDGDGNAMAYKNDCFITSILKVHLTEKATQLLDSALTLD